MHNVKQLWNLENVAINNREIVNCRYSTFNINNRDWSAYKLKRATSSINKLMYFIVV